MNNPNKILKQPHEGRKLQSLLNLMDITPATLINELGLSSEKLIELYSSSVIDKETLQQVAFFLKMTVEDIKNFHEETTYHNTINSENNTIINYNHTINQNSIEDISKIYEIVRELVLKEKDRK